MTDHHETEYSGSTKTGSPILFNAVIKRRDQGGVTNEVKNFREAKMLSTADVCLRLGVPGLRSTWIRNVLNVAPEVVVRNGQAFYLSEAQLSEIRLAFIRHLSREV